MSEAWLHVGASVFVTSGPFRGFEEVVDRIDPSEDAVVVNVELFGRPVPLTFPLCGP
jgi:transcription antitermination factor NusG